MGFRLRKGIIIWIGMIGILITLYPLISRTWESSEKERAIEQYWQSVHECTRLDLLYEEGATYNLGLITGNIQQEYQALLSLQNTEIIGILSIPKLALHIPIYHGTSEYVLNKGIGHLEGTSLPLEGEEVHAVLCGHSGMPNLEIFDHIDELAKGDMIYIYVLGQRNAYEVIDLMICLPEEAGDQIYIQEDKNLVTLLTCTPYGINTHRLLVIAELKNETEG